MTSARLEGHNSIRALAVCHYTLYLHETQKPGVVGHDAEPRGAKMLRCTSTRTTRHYWRLQDRRACNVVYCAIWWPWLHVLQHRYIHGIVMIVFVFTCAGVHFYDWPQDAERINLRSGLAVMVQPEVQVVGSFGFFRFSLAAQKWWFLKSVTSTGHSAGYWFWSKPF